MRKKAEVLYFDNVIKNGAQALANVLLKKNILKKIIFENVCVILYKKNNCYYTIFYRIYEII